MSEFSIAGMETVPAPGPVPFWFKATRAVETAVFNLPTAPNCGNPEPFEVILLKSPEDFDACREQDWPEYTFVGYPWGSDNYNYVLYGRLADEWVQFASPEGTVVHSPP